MGFTSFNQEEVSGSAETPDKVISEVAREEPETEAEASINAVTDTTIEDQLGESYLHRYRQEPITWMDSEAAPEETPAAEFEITNASSAEPIASPPQLPFTAPEQFEPDLTSASSPSLDQEGAPEIFDHPDEATPVEQEATLTEAEAASDMTPGATEGATIEDSLRRLRLRQFGRDATPWIDEAHEAPEEKAVEVREAPVEETIEETDRPNEAVVATDESAEAGVAASYTTPERPSAEEATLNELISEKQKALADEAAEHTGIVLDRMANIAAEQLRNMLRQVAATALHQTNRVLGQLVEDSVEQTARMMEKLSLEATSRVRQELVKLAEKEITPPLSASVSDLSGEVRRIGRELFKATRAAERNQDLFDSALTEIQQLTSRIERVPEQLHGTESITEVKAALCREMLGLADALEASISAAHETLEQLQGLEDSEETGEEASEEISEEISEESPEEIRAEESRPEEIRVEEEVGPAEIRESSQQSESTSATPPFWRWAFWKSKLQEWASRLAPPPSASSAPQPSAEASLRATVDELQERLDETLDAMSQWLDGQQLIYERLQMIMQNVGVRQIETEGVVFDPSRHRAVSVEMREDVPAGTVIGEERKGYSLDGKILRYAEVIVAKNE
jgi:molecular chaperone GrpE